MVKHQHFALVRLESMRLRLNVGGSTAISDVWVHEKSVLGINQNLFRIVL